MLFEFNDGKEGKCEIGFRFVYPEPKQTFTEPIPLDWLICPVSRLAELIASYASNANPKRMEAAMTGKLLIDVEPRKVLCVVEKFRTYDGKREKECKLFETQAVCHPNDIYSKRVGRFGAFKRAVKTLLDMTSEVEAELNGGESELNRKIWNAFRQSGCKFPSQSELSRANEYELDEEEMIVNMKEPW